MKKTPIFLLLFLALGLVRVFAQNAALSPENWEQIETADKEFSIAFPKDYLVNIQSRTDADRTSVFAFQNGVAMQLSFRRQFDARDNLARLRIEQSKNPKVLDYKVGDFYGKSVVYTNAGYENTLYIASKSGYYVINIKAAAADAPEIAYLLNSIKLKNEPLFVSRAGTKAAPGTVVSTKTFETSPQVKEIIKRKSGKIERTVSFAPLAAFSEEAVDYSVRPAFVLTEVYPARDIPFRAEEKGGELKIRARLLANGQVGDITVYSDMDRTVLRSFAESVEKMKFVPAQKSDGTPVDSVRTFSSHFGVSVTTTIFTVK